MYGWDADVLKFTCKFSPVLAAIFIVSFTEKVLACFDNFNTSKLTCFKRMPKDGILKEGCYVILSCK